MPQRPTPVGRLTLLRRAHQTFWYSSAVESSVLVTVGPRANFARGKTTLPRAGARNPRKGRASSSLSGWPQAPSGVPDSPLSFFREDLHRSPSEYKRFPPTGEKPQDPWGPSWPRLGPSRGESRPQKLRNRTGCYRFGHHNSCGTRNMMSSAHAPCTNCACAK